MTLTQLRYFQIVAQEEHLTRSAQIINIAQPALSVALVKLEKELGIRLFDRKGRSIQLNESGRILLKYVDKLLAEADDAERELSEISGKQGQVLNLGLTSFVATQEMIKSFAKSNPHIRLKQELILPIDIPSKLRLGALDFVISNLPIQENDIESTLLLRQRLLLAVPKDHPFSNYKKIDLEQAKDEDFICVAEGHADRIFFDQFCLEAGFRQNVVLEYFQSQMLDLVADGVGIALAVDHKIRNKKYNRQISFIPITKPDRMRSVYLLWNKNRAAAFAAKEFRKFSACYFLEKSQK